MILSVHRIALALSLLCALAVLIFILSGHLEKAGPFFIAAFITLAIGFSVMSILKVFPIR